MGARMSGAQLPRRAGAALLLAFAAGIAHADGGSPVGLWKTIDDKTRKERSLVRVTESGGVLTGRIEKRLDPAASPDDVCAKCSDDRKDKPLLGLEILRGVKKSSDDTLRWDGGQILDPENGKTYQVRLMPVAEGQQLEVRGYIGAPLIGRTQTWVRVE